MNRILNPALILMSFLTINLRCIQSEFALLICKHQTMQIKRMMACERSSNIIFTRFAYRRETQQCNHLCGKLQHIKEHVYGNTEGSGDLASISCRDQWIHCRHGFVWSKFFLTDTQSPLSINWRYRGLGDPSIRKRQAVGKTGHGVKRSMSLSLSSYTWPATAWKPISNRPYVNDTATQLVNSIASCLCLAKRYFTRLVTKLLIWRPY